MAGIWQTHTKKKGADGSNPGSSLFRPDSPKPVRPSCAHASSSRSRFAPPLAILPSLAALHSPVDRSKAGVCLSLCLEFGPQRREPAHACAVAQLAIWETRGSTHSLESLPRLQRCREGKRSRQRHRSIAHRRAHRADRSPAMRAKAATTQTRRVLALPVVGCPARRADRRGRRGSICRSERSATVRRGGKQSPKRSGV